MTEEGAASARCCGSVNSNRNASGAIRMNGEMEPLGMRAELRSWRLIVDKIPDQGAPARDMLEEAGNWSLKMLGKFPGLGVRRKTGAKGRSFDFRKPSTGL